MNSDLFWPTLEKEKNDNSNNLFQKDIESINEILPILPLNLILEEVRRLYDQELERRSTKDNKAGIYIATSTTLITMLLSFAPNLLNLCNPFSFNQLKILDFFVIITFLHSIALFIRCAMWAHKALKVSPLSLIHWKILIKHKSKKKLELHLIKDLLTCLLKNYELTNKTVTYVKMAQELIISASFWLLICLLLRVVLFFF